MAADILIAAFEGTSAEILTEGGGFDRLLLPSDLVRDRELLFSQIGACTYDYVIAAGQKPVIKNKVCIETTARMNGIVYETDFDCVGLKGLFEGRGIAANISRNCGTSYCNSIYWHGMSYIKERGLAAKLVFVHVPFEKNIEDMNAFKKGFSETVNLLYK